MSWAYRFSLNLEHHPFLSLNLEHHPFLSLPYPTCCLHAHAVLPGTQYPSPSHQIHLVLDQEK